MSARAMEGEGERRGPDVVLPGGVTASEATLLLAVFARLKQKRFGRLTVTVSDGRVVDVELLEKLDRNLFRAFPGATP